ncbi:sel1 repeat family protein [Rhodobacter sp. NTK016B]|uniref:tetratricopeptide repeat protein n=1 Tax=Rhodobacter sp. NTK016B TaxID=2759676 RepID=UPI001A8D3250|nr:tetratricopeptide repeat protein [Rhodobacter sp. NTK016B]MBN8291726.1 sel1 repeat family protein [Rhodobacter sp. NTK016B]
MGRFFAPIHMTPAPAAALPAFSAVLAVVLSLGCAAPVMAQSASTSTATQSVDDRDYEAARRAFRNGEHEEALRVLVPLAERNHPGAQFLLGYAYRQGRGVAESAPQALHWYDRAARLGHERARLNAAIMLRNGAPGVPVDLDRSRAYLESGEADGQAPAIAELGRVYERGLGVLADEARAIALYERAHALDDDWAPFYLGRLLYRRHATDADWRRARTLFRAGADHGVPVSLNNLAWMLHNGQGGETDLDAAEVLYRRALDMGYTRSGLHLAMLLNLREPHTQIGDAEIVQYCQPVLADPDMVWSRQRNCHDLMKHVTDRGLVR